MNRQIVIEIDNKAFNFIKEYSFVENTEVMLKQSVEDRVKTLMLFDMINALKNGTPLPKGHGVLTIPENPTNGDMVKALFGVDVVDDFNYTLGVKLNNSNYIQINKDWWNAPYNADKEVDE